MQLIVIKYDDTIDLSAFPKGTTDVSLQKDTDTAPGGVVLFKGEGIDAELVPHTILNHTPVVFPPPTE